MNPNRHKPTPAKTARALGGAGREQWFRMPPKHPACGKRRCETWDQALSYLLRLARLSKDPLRIYECDGPSGCGGFHLTKLHDWEDR